MSALRLARESPASPATPSPRRPPLAVGASAPWLESHPSGSRSASLARSASTSSKRATIADDIVNSSLILGLGFGLCATTGSAAWATLSLVGVGLYATYTSVIYHHLITQARSGYALGFR